MKTIGSIIASKRKEGFSLNKLEKITNKNRSSILRYQRDQIRIPEDVAKKLAVAFYNNYKDQENFLKFWDKSHSLIDKEIEGKSQRRKEKTKAAKKFECAVYSRITPERLQNNENLWFKMLIHGKFISDSGCPIFITIKDKKTDLPVMLLDKRYGLKLISYTSSNGLINSKKVSKGTNEDWNGTISMYMQFCRKMKIGIYSILDLAKEKLENAEYLKSSKHNDGQMLLIERNFFEGLKNSAKKALEIGVKMKEEESTPLLLTDSILKWLVSASDAVLSKSQHVEEWKEDVLLTISGIDKKISQ